MKKTLIFAAALLLSCGVLGAQEKVRPANEKTQYNTVFDLLRAEPGVQVSPGGDNGQMPRIIIRGVGTNSDQTQPLFIVDGLQVESIASIDPNNIYQIDIIKDGTSSIYGMQGANGVIMVTTKSAVHAQEAEAAAKKAARQAKKEARKKKNAE